MVKGYSRITLREGKNRGRTRKEEKNRKGMRIREDER